MPVEVEIQVREIAELGDELVLYGTTACHLCEVAEALLEQHCTEVDPISYTKIDISASDELFHRYGIRIPVLRRADLRTMLLQQSLGHLAQVAGSGAV